MKNQLQKTIAELIITRELLKQDLDKYIYAINTAPNDQLLKASNDLIDANTEIQMINDLIKVLIKKEKLL